MYIFNALTLAKIHYYYFCMQNSYVVGFHISGIRNWRLKIIQQENKVVIQVGGKPVLLHV